MLKLKKCISYFLLKECSSLWASGGLLSLVSCSRAPQQKIFAKLTLLPKAATKEQILKINVSQKRKKNMMLTPNFWKGQSKGRESQQFIKISSEITRQTVILLQGWLCVRAKKATWLKSSIWLTTFGNKVHSLLILWCHWHQRTQVSNSHIIVSTVGS